jgi:phosphoribosylformimino-5-aminoimidazole carboxamide ribotide isomerase
LKILPSLNILNGAVVPVCGPEPESCDPASLLDLLLDQGHHRLALVDVDAARGTGNNRELLARLMHRFHKGAGKACVQVSGGIRSSDEAQYFLDNGATWLAVGTLLQRSPIVMEQLLARFRENLTAGLDARNGEIQSSGWRESARILPEEAAARIRDHGFKRMLFMDIPGSVYAEPDFRTAGVLSRSARIPLFMGGSIHCREHLKQASEIPGIQGLVVDALQFKLDPDLAGSLGAVQG